MSTFTDILTRDNSKIKKDRADRLEKITKSTMDTLVSEIENEKLSIEDRLASQLDVSTDNRSTTINRVEDWDARSILEERVKLEVELEKLSVRLNAAKKVENELFG